jgi:hypothetical protein
MSDRFIGMAWWFPDEILAFIDEAIELPHIRRAKGHHQEQANVQMNAGD